MATELTQQLVKELFDYHEDGYLVWKVDRGVNKTKGLRAGYLNKQVKGDRCMVSINSKDMPSSRLIFLWHHGYIPKVVDHENNITTDDKINNLRDADWFKNARNKTSAKGSTSIYLGVCQFKKGNDWFAQIRAHGKIKPLGFHKTQEEAALVYNREAVRYYGEFANLNIIQNGRP